MDCPGDDGAEEEEGAPAADPRPDWPRFPCSFGLGLHQALGDEGLAHMAGRQEWGPKIMVALAIGYDGRAYRGLQQNATPEQCFLRTVEAELELALFRAGAIHPSNFGNLWRIRWSRNGRTDKGVSAACNIVAARLVLDNNGSDLGGLVERVNQLLPEDIVLHGAVPVTRRFDARREGSRRSYVYLLPTYCLEPVLDRVGRAQVAHSSATGRPLRRFTKEDVQCIEAAAGLPDTRVSSRSLGLFKKALDHFKGWQWFGNFCGDRHLRPGDDRGYRNIRELECGEPFVDERGRQWLEVSVCGDSFVQHQIRKMLGTAVLVAQGLLTLQFVYAALNKDVVCPTHTLPPGGLIFLRPDFDDLQRPAAQAVQRLIAEHGVQSSISSWLAGLRRGIIARDAEECRWARWLAIMAQNDPQLQQEARRAIAKRAILHDYWLQANAAQRAAPLAQQLQELPASLNALENNVEERLLTMGDTIDNVDCSPTSYEAPE